MNDCIARLKKCGSINKTSIVGRRCLLETEAAVSVAMTITLVLRSLKRLSAEMTMPHTTYQHYIKL